MRKSFRGAASVTKTPPFAVTPVMETFTATAASGSTTYIHYNKRYKNLIFRVTLEPYMEIFALTPKKDGCDLECIT